jgi:hypothetical protein
MSLPKALRWTEGGCTMRIKIFLVVLFALILFLLNAIPVSATVTLAIASTWASSDKFIAEQLQSRLAPLGCV